jgi:AraC-like DNA-binding protein
MSLYTTPLQFGYFLALLLAGLLWLRGWREERLSDRLLGGVMALLALEVQDYTFGFAGINVLWEELNGFPRSANLLFAPACYFYLKSQINQHFRLRPAHALHLIPWGLYFLLSLVIFVQGKYAVQAWQSSPWAEPVDVLLSVAALASYLVYFWMALRLYWGYRRWSETQFSDPDSLSFVWYRNFLYAVVFEVSFKWLWHGVDYLLDLDFYQDWWWNLGSVAIICYVGLNGYRQLQPRALRYDPPAPEASAPPVEAPPPDPEREKLRQRLLALMDEEKPYLQAELSLADLAARMRVAPALLSQVINGEIGKHFNDFVNEYRVAEFQRQALLPENRAFTLLSIAFACGFNSKATFNRAFRKHSGMSPREYVEAKQG